MVNINYASTRGRHHVKKQEIETASEQKHIIKAAKLKPPKQNIYNKIKPKKHTRKTA